MNGPDLFEAAAARDRAMAAVESHAGRPWREHALEVVRSVAAGKGRFTTDDVMEALSTPAHDARAMGPVMRVAVRMGIIAFTGEYVPSRRRHCAPIRVWETTNHQ